MLDLNYDYARNNSIGNANGKTGHLTKITDNLNTAKNKEYEYDALGRLTKAKGGTNSLWTQSYSYDRFGNRLNVVATGVGIDGQTMQKDGTPNLTYDTLTNRITESPTSYQYDVAGNLTRGQDADGNWLKYEYDAANRLQVIKKASDNSYVQAFQFGSSNQRLMDMDYGYGYLKIFGNGGAVEYTEFAGAVPTWTKSYVRLGGSILSTITPNGSGGETIEFNHPGRLGINLTTNQQSGTFSEQNSLPFGTALGSETTPNNNTKKFTSYERSARTGLDYAINRTYDSKLGRFTQVDPIKMASTSLTAPQTLNLYSYCGNDPINHTDSNGLFWGFFKKFFKWVMVAVAVVVAVVAIVTFNFPAGAGIIKGLVAILGLVSQVSQSASVVLSALGQRKAANIFSWISRISGGFGNLLAKQGQIKLTPGIFGFDGKPAPLGPKYSKLYKDAFDILLALLKDPNSACYKFLVKSGFDPKKLVGNLEKRVPYDGLTSTNDAQDLGFAGQSIKETFGMFKKGSTAKPKIYPRGATDNAGNIYYTKAGLNVQTILHENIHSTFESATGQWNIYDPTNKASDPTTGVRNLGKSRILDSEVQQNLGISQQPDTTNIDDKLRQEGCK